MKRLAIVAVGLGLISATGWAGVRPTVTASRCNDTDTTLALFDRCVPVASGDCTVPRFTFWPNKGREEWVEIKLDAPRTFGGFEVYWFDDVYPGLGNCALPASWAVQCRTASGDWQDVPGEYPVVRDGFSVATFKAPVTCRQFRLRVRLAERYSGGILEACFPGERPPLPQKAAPHAKLKRRIELRRNALEPLPIGSVMPEGWLKHQLDRMTEGLVGRLYETSEFLTPENGWLSPVGKG